MTDVPLKRRDYLNNVIGKEKLSAVYCKYCICRIYCTEDSVDEETMSRRILQKIEKIMLPKDYLAYTSKRLFLY